MCNRHLVAAIVALWFGAGSLFAQPRVDDRKIDDWRTNVKTWTEFKTNSGHRNGEVVEVGEGSVTVRCATFPKGRIVLSQVYPIDLLTVGKIVDGVSANYAYRWSDIQKGDTVSLTVIHDHGENRDYCIGVSISCRPGGKLPESQNPKKDVRYARDSLFNDIDNGEDVSDDTIAKVLPPVIHPRTKVLEEPGGLPKEYQEKLDAIREKAKAKKDKDLKATPPEKK